MPKSFEELAVWQSTLQLIKIVYHLTNTDRFKKDYGLSDQMRRAAVSILSNIAEGFERGSNTEFIQFLYIAKGSSGELRAQLYVANELGYIAKQDFNKCLLLCKDISGQLSGFISYLKGSRLKGEKFRVQYKSLREEMKKELAKFNIQDSKFKETDS